MFVQIVGRRVDVQEAGDDLSARVVLVDVADRRQRVTRIEAVREFAQPKPAAVVLRDLDDLAGLVRGRDAFAPRHEVEAVDGIVVLAHVVVALGAAGMVVECHARADHVEERGTAVAERALDQRHELVLVAGEAARDIGDTELQRQRHHVDGSVAVDRPALGLRAAIGGGRELALGQPVDPVVLADIGHVDAAPDQVRELTEADRRRIAIARHAQVLRNRECGEYVFA